MIILQPMQHYKYLHQHPTLWNALQVPDQRLAFAATQAIWLEAA